MKQTDNFDRGPHQWSTTQERNRDHLYDWCDLGRALQTIRGQWKSSILIALSQDKSTIPQLQDHLAAINRRVLVRALRELEADGLIARQDMCDTAYQLTPDAEALVKILHDLASWQAQRS